MAGFPQQGHKFPSTDWALAFAQYDENDAWYSGDQAALQAVYGSTATGGKTRGDADSTHYNKRDNTRRRGGIRGILARMFNGAIVADDEQRTRMHAPVAANIATLSADLLTAEPPVFRLVNTAGEEQGQAYKGDAQDNLDVILNGKATKRTLSHAAELTAGLGATVLVANWDKAIADHPWLDVIACDAAIPEFVAGRLSAVNLYTTHNQTDAAGQVTNTLVHVERHEIGKIIHGVLAMNPDGSIGSPRPLTDLAATEHIPSIAGSIVGALDQTVELPTGIDLLTAAWWRNLPTKTFRKYGELSMVGRADTEGMAQFLDAIDEVWSSWMRDIKIARARLIVPETMLEFQGPGLGGAFDTDRELLTALAYTDLGPNDGKIQAQQFEIRAEEHAMTLLALTKEAVQAAGYSLSSYDTQGSGDGATATEVVDRTTLTERTRDKKFLYFAEAAEPIALALMALDAAHFGGEKIPDDLELNIDIPDLSQIDPEKQARIFQYLRTAMAVSTDTIVRDLHPEWDDTQIDAEVDRIMAENNLTAELDPGTEGRVDDPTQPVEDPANPGFDMTGAPMPAIPAPTPEVLPATQPPTPAPVKA